MEKYSVKNPFTVLVGVIMVLLLGFVAVTKMQTDLLPDINTPYLMVVTVYPGASPERVESEVSQPLENTLGTVSGVQTITSTSAENYSILQLSFAEGTDMDSALVKVSNSLEQAAETLPDLCLTPSILELNVNMSALMTVSVGREGYDIYELSDFLDESVIPYLQRQGGVSSLSSSGLVDKIVQVQLNQDKIDEVNVLLLEEVNTQLAAAKAQLDAAEAQVNDGRAQLEAAKASFGQTVSQTVMDKIAAAVGDATEEFRAQTQALLESIDNLIAVVQEPEIQQALIEVRQGLQQIMDRISATKVQTIDDLIEIVAETRVLTEKLTVALQKLQERLDAEQGTGGSSAGDLMDALQITQSLETVYSTLEGVLKAMDSVPEMMDQFQDAYADLNQSQMEALLAFTEAQRMLADGEEQLAAAKAEYETARENALASADVNKMLTIDVLSQLIYAQNFSMPAGYIDDKDDNSWLLKVGEEYDSIDDLTGALLISVEGVGEIHLSDVADVVVVDNAEDTYTRLNGERAVVLSIYKNTTASSNEVSNNCLAAFEELEARYEGLNIVVLSNQGNYITILIQSILGSMAVGALLAIIVLAFFLRDVKPTLVVGISIPLSVLFAIVLMYFSGLTMNIMTLAGLSLGIGMLVDNSIVVIENIYRLRSRGVPAPRAAVQGARQMEGAIIASTLTSVCVFLPVVFSQELTRDLLQPMSLCIGYCLMASLIVALTVAPAAASTVLRQAKVVRLPWFERFQEKYGRSLEWCLQHKKLPLLASIALFAVSAWVVFSMGIVMLPEITTTEIKMSITTPDTMTREESYAMAGEILEKTMDLELVDQVGVSTDTSIYGIDVGMLGGQIQELLSATTTGYGKYTYHLTLEEGASNRDATNICNQLEELMAQYEGCTASVSQSGMEDLTSLLGNGLTVNVYGPDLDTLEELSEQVVEIINSTEGFENATNGLGEGEQTIELQIDKDKARACGLTVAQIYQSIAARLTTSTTSTNITIDGSTMTVKVVSDLDPLTVENLMDMSFNTSNLAADGSTVYEVHTLREFATTTTGTTPNSILRENQSRYISITADTVRGYNTTVQSRQLQRQFDELSRSGALPEGYSISLGGETSTVNYMTEQMVEWMALALPFVYFVMVAQFQSLLSPFIVLFTIPLAFTGGMIGLVLTGHQLSLMSLMGFIILMGTVVNNGILFVDYTNQLRLGGMDRRAALIATGKTRMRPILMTALTTVLAMCQLMFSNDMASQMMSGMAIVIIGGLTYATLMTLYIVPIMYDILFKKPPLAIDVGGDELDDVPDDAAEFIAASRAAEEAGSDAEPQVRPDTP